MTPDVELVVATATVCARASSQADLSHGQQRNRSDHAPVRRQSIFRTSTPRTEDDEAGRCEDALRFAGEGIPTEGMRLVSSSCIRAGDRPFHAFLSQSAERERGASPTLCSEAFDLDAVSSQGIANLARGQSKQARRLRLYPPGSFHGCDHALAIGDFRGPTTGRPGGPSGVSSLLTG